MSEEIEIEISPLGCEYSLDGKTVQVEIYRGAEEPGWILEVVDELGNSTVWEEPLETDQAALDQFYATIKEEGLDSLIGPFEE